MPPGSSGNEEIQRFEDQYRRNPDTLVFARLADACRKAGDPERALQLLREGIGKHPDYPTAHLVRARALVDVGRPADAEESLRRVLELDAQNLVAMRDIAVLAEQRGDPLESVHWYEQIAALDPGNPEAVEALDRLRGTLQRTPPGMEPLPAPQEEWWSSPTFEVGDETAGDETAGTPEAEPESVMAAESEPEPELEAESELEPEMPVELTADDLRPTRSDPGVLAEKDAAAELDALAAELDAGMEADRSLEELEEPETPEEPEATPEPEEPAAADRGTGKTTAWWFEDPADAESTDEGDDGDLLTRTMADLYVKQGLLDDAAAIYRELLADRPDDEDLQSALRDVERQLAGPEPSHPAPEPEPADAPEPEPTDAQELAPADAPELAPALEPAEASATPAEPPAQQPEPAPELPLAESPPAAVDPYASHPVPTTAGTSQVFRDWLRRLSG